MVHGGVVEEIRLGLCLHANGDRGKGDLPDGRGLLLEAHNHWTPVPSLPHVKDEPGTPVDGEQERDEPPELLRQVSLPVAHVLDAVDCAVGTEVVHYVTTAVLPGGMSLRGTGCVSVCGRLGRNVLGIFFQNLIQLGLFLFLPGDHCYARGLTFDSD